MSTYSEKRLDYKSAGVHIDAGNALVQRIKSIASKTQTSGVLSGLGGFGSLFELPLDEYTRPVLVSGTDGVGTKLKLAFELDTHQTIGIDLVAMCVNDILVQGAKPLFFLDYFATGRLDIDIAELVINGIGKGCELAGAALVGGETAEMPGMYSDGEYDLAGFCVGIVEKNEIIDGSKVEPGDKLIGLASSGPHSNGYSLIRKILEQKHISLEKELAGKKLGSLLLEPTRIYVKSLLTLVKTQKIHGLAHITGGGITENMPRILQHGLHAEIDLNQWRIPPIFYWLQEQGNLELNEMLRTFNCGIGMIICVSAENEKATSEALRSNGETVFSIGSIIESDGDSTVKYV